MTQNLYFWVFLWVAIDAANNCNYVAYGGNEVHYYPVGKCWTNYYDSRHPEIASSYQWKCSQDGTNVTYYYYNNSFDCTGNGYAEVTFTSEKNYNCNGVDCAIIVRKYESKDKKQTIYGEYPYVSSTCFEDVYPGSVGYWRCDQYAVFEFFWLGMTNCDFLDTNSYQVFTTYASDNTSIIECNMG